MSRRSMVAASPKPCPFFSSTRTTEAWQHAHCFSPNPSSAGKMRTISSLLPSVIRRSVYKKTPPTLRSRVKADDSPAAPLVRIFAGTLTGIRDRARFSDFESDMGVRAYHVPSVFRTELFHNLTVKGKGARTDALMI